jgi:hypothetical protein
MNDRAVGRRRSLHRLPPSRRAGDGAASVPPVVTTSAPRPTDARSAELPPLQFERLRQLRLLPCVQSHQRRAARRIEQQRLRLVHELVYPRPLRRVDPELGSEGVDPVRDGVKLLARPTAWFRSPNSKSELLAIAALTPFRITSNARPLWWTPDGNWAMLFAAGSLCRIRLRATDVISLLRSLLPQSLLPSGPECWPLFPRPGK